MLLILSVCTQRHACSTSARGRHGALHIHATRRLSAALCCTDSAPPLPSSTAQVAVLDYQSTLCAAAECFGGVAAEKRVRLPPCKTPHGLLAAVPRARPTDSAHTHSPCPPTINPHSPVLPSSVRVILPHIPRPPVRPPATGAYARGHYTTHRPSPWAHRCTLHRQMCRAVPAGSHCSHWSAATIDAVCGGCLAACGGGGSITAL